MNIVFLDIDGVLNNQDTLEKTPDGFIGIDDKLIEPLAYFVKKYDFKIVLISSWKDSWEKDGQSRKADGHYIDEKLAKFDIKVTDKTIDKWSNRGCGINKYVKENNVEKFVVFDDEIFSDYERYDILSHLVKVDYHCGLLQCDIDEAKEKLGLK